MFQYFNFVKMSYMGNIFSDLAQNWLFTEGISTTDVVKSLFKSDQKVIIYLHLCNSSITHDSVTKYNLSI